MRHHHIVTPGLVPTRSHRPPALRGEPQRASAPRIRLANPLVTDVIELVGATTRTPPRLLLHPSRCRARVAAARQLAMYLMHVMLGKSLTEVGQCFGRDRTTVAHACAKIEDQRDDAGFDRYVMRLEDQIAETILPEAAKQERADVC